MGGAVDKADQAIRIECASQNNLKSVSLNLPLHRLVGIAGASGSGKSSLVHHVIGAVGARRLGRLRLLPSSLARAYGPDVCGIANLPTCIDVQQEPLRGQSRSTVATYSGVMDALAQLVCQHGIMLSPGGEAIVSPDRIDMAAWLVRHYKGSTVSIAEVHPDAEIRHPRQLLPPKAMFYRERNGFWRAAPDEAIPQKDLPARLWVASVKKSVEIRNLASARKIVGRASGGLLWIIDGHIFLEGGFNQVAPDVPYSYLPLSPRLLSFNSLAIGTGRCRSCEGMGVRMGVSEQSIIRHLDRPILNDGLNLPKSEGRFRHLASLDCVLRGLLRVNNLPLDAAWRAIPQGVRNIILYGSGQDPVPELHASDDRLRPARRPFAGLVELVKARVASAGAARDALSGLVNEANCPECGGTRLNRSARACYYRGINISGILLKTALSELCDNVARWKATSRGKELAALAAVGSLVHTCVDLNLGYLTLGRTTSSLSGGEAQRIRLAVAMAVDLQDCCYLLDEPSRALHTKDVRQLATAIGRLAERNTVLMVEHHPLLLKSVDELVDMGPCGGDGGGSVVYQGPPRSESHGTPAKLLGSRAVEPLKPNGQWIRLSGLTVNNVKRATFQIPMNRLTLVVGVSGAGKSSAILGGLVPATKALIDGVEWHNGRLHIPRSLHFVEVVAQKLGSKSRRSVVATHLGILDAIRNRFASQDACEAIGLGASDFSFNSRGACPACEGAGVARDGFGNDLDETCHACAGRRLSERSQLIRLGNDSIAELLDKTISDLASRGHIAINSAALSLLRIAVDLGLGYLQLSRATPTLSAGERQRLGLVRYLGRVSGEIGAGLLVLDEPTAGLSAIDAQWVFRRLSRHAASAGHTLVAIEHKIDLIRESDWIIEFGPAGGAKGGKVIFQGPPEELPRADTPTAQLLRGEITDAKASKIRRTPPTVAGKIDRGLNWASQATAFEKLIGLSELTADDDIHRPLLPAIAVHTDRVPADTRVVELLDLLPAIRPLVQPKLPDEIVAVAHMSDVERELDGRSFGFSPVSLQRRLGLATPSDWAEAARRLLRCGLELVWFQGRTHPLKRFRSLLNSQAVIFNGWVVCSSRASSATRQIALRWSQGVTRLFEGPDEGRVISTRFLQTNEEGGAFGVQFNDAHIGDCRSINGRCSVCHGNGMLATYPIGLVVADAGKTIDDDRFWQPEVLAAIRALRHVRLIPEAKFYASQLVANFLQPLELMDRRTRRMFEHGIPWRRFSKPLAKRIDRVQDHYLWRGIHDSVYEVFGAIKEPFRARLKDGFRYTKCDSCDGTGIGWEAGCLFLDDEKLIHALKSCSLRHLLEVHRIRSVSLAAAIALGSGHLRCYDRFSDLEQKDRRNLLVAMSKGSPLRNATLLMDNMGDSETKLVSKFLRQEGMIYIQPD